MHKLDVLTVASNRFWLAAQHLRKPARWATPTAIKENASAFVKETKHVIGILADRIKRENQELYAAADRSEGGAF